MTAEQWDAIIGWKMRPEKVLIRVTPDPIVIHARSSSRSRYLWTRTRYRQPCSSSIFCPKAARPMIPELQDGSGTEVTLIANANSYGYP